MRCDLRTEMECDCPNGTCRVQSIYVVKPKPTPCNTTPFAYGLVALSFLIGIWFAAVDGYEEQKRIDRHNQEVTAR